MTQTTTTRKTRFTVRTLDFSDIGLGYYSDLSARQCMMKTTDRYPTREEAIMAIIPAACHYFRKYVTEATDLGDGPKSVGAPRRHDVPAAPQSKDPSWLRVEHTFDLLTIADGDHGYYGHLLIRDCCVAETDVYPTREEAILAIIPAAAYHFRDFVVYGHGD